MADRIFASDAVNVELVNHCMSWRFNDLVAHCPFTTQACGEKALLAPAAWQKVVGNCITATVVVKQVVAVPQEAARQLTYPGKPTWQDQGGAAIFFCWH